MIGSDCIKLLQRFKEVRGDSVIGMFMIYGSIGINEEHVKLVPEKMVDEAKLTFHQIYDVKICGVRLRNNTVAPLHRNREVEDQEGEQGKILDRQSLTQKSMKCYVTIEKVSNGRNEESKDSIACQSLKTYRQKCIFDFALKKIKFKKEIFDESDSGEEQSFFEEFEQFFGQKEGETCGNVRKLDESQSMKGLSIEVNENTVDDWEDLMDGELCEGDHALANILVRDLDKSLDEEKHNTQVLKQEADIVQDVMEVELYEDGVPLSRVEGYSESELDDLMEGQIFEGDHALLNARVPENLNEEKIDGQEVQECDSLEDIMEGDLLEGEHAFAEEKCTVQIL